MPDVVNMEELKDKVRPEIVLMLDALVETLEVVVVDMKECGLEQHEIITVLVSSVTTALLREVKSIEGVYEIMAGCAESIGKSISPSEKEEVH